MTRDDHEEAARATANEARRRVREQFQVRHPHYTPYLGAPNVDWSDWLKANLAMHGVDGFIGRGLHEVAKFDDFDRWAGTLPDQLVDALSALK